MAGIRSNIVINLPLKLNPMLTGLIQTNVLLVVARSTCGPVTVIKLNADSSNRPGHKY